MGTDGKRGRGEDKIMGRGRVKKGTGALAEKLIGRKMGRGESLNSRPDGKTKSS